MILLAFVLLLCDHANFQETVEIDPKVTPIGADHIEISINNLSEVNSSPNGSLSLEVFVDGNRSEGPTKFLPPFSSLAVIKRLNACKQHNITMAVHSESEAKNYSFEYLPPGIESLLSIINSSICIGKLSSVNVHFWNSNISETFAGETCFQGLVFSRGRTTASQHCNKSDQLHSESPGSTSCSILRDFQKKKEKLNNITITLLGIPGGGGDDLKMFFEEDLKERDHCNKIWTNPERDLGSYEYLETVLLSIISAHLMLKTLRMSVDSSGYNEPDTEPSWLRMKLMDCYHLIRSCCLTANTPATDTAGEKTEA